MYNKFIYQFSVIDSFIFIDFYYYNFDSQLLFLLAELYLFDTRNKTNRKGVTHKLCSQIHCKWTRKFENTSRILEKSLQTDKTA